MSDLFVFAGEASGDLHGAKLLEALYRLQPDLKVSGVGGARMRAVGLSCVMPMENFQVMGFIDVLLALPKLIRQFYTVRRAILEQNPQAVVLIDYPGFNLRMEKHLRRQGYRGFLCHYICPSVWAWGKNRIPAMAKHLDLLLTILPFEAQYFSHTSLRDRFETKVRSILRVLLSRISILFSRVISTSVYDPRKKNRNSAKIIPKIDEPLVSKRSLKVQYVGHPLVKTLSEHIYHPLPIPAGKRLVGLFPGSRKKELLRNFTMQLRVAKKLLALHPDLFFGISVADARLLPLIRALIEQEGLALDRDLFLTQATYDLMQSCAFAIAKSGTVTLELALHQVPTVVTYGISPLDLFIAKYLLRIRLPYYCIVNILCQKEVFPELIGPHLTEEALFQTLSTLLARKEVERACRDNLAEVRRLLQNKDASAEAARAILQGAKQR